MGHQGENLVHPRPWPHPTTRCMVMLDVHDKRCKPSSWIRQPLPRTYPSTFVNNDKDLPDEGWLFAFRYVKALAYCFCLYYRYSTAAITFCSHLGSSLLLLSLPPLFHRRHNFFHLGCVALAGCLLAWLSHALHGLHTHCCLQRGKQGMLPKPPGGQEGSCSTFVYPTSNW